MPVPSRELSASSVQRYEQGAAKQLEDDPSNEVGDPVTGEDGLNVKAGTGAGFDGLLAVIVTSELLDSAPSDAVRRNT